MSKSKTRYFDEDYTFGGWLKSHRRGQQRVMNVIDNCVEPGERCSRTPISRLLLSDVKNQLTVMTSGNSQTHHGGTLARNDNHQPLVQKDSVRNKVRSLLNLKFQSGFRFKGVLFTSLCSDTDASVLRGDIAVLLAKDAIELVPPAEMKSGFYSTYFIVSKKSGGLRSILDLQDWFAAINLKDAYFHVLILPRHRPFLWFAFEGRAYQYKALPFGLALFPRVFTKLAEGALAPFTHKTSHLGLRVKWEKSKLSSVQSISFLSVELDLAQDSGPSKTFSEAPRAYGSRSYAAQLASYETTSALATRLDPKMGMAPWHSPGQRYPGMSLPVQSLVRWLLQKPGTPGGPLIWLSGRWAGGQAFGIVCGGISDRVTSGELERLDD
ncbi:hypothetical protein H4Q32_030391 [Labeo rohita]|uniref:Reverse transcriptase domain-containing protein n=1 Tax=Labeo rohita TaxID=84645 RepID=A0ABQ8L5J9_LABRO|nr:hypothetical protein H4Q32_030391 [Labeo rohita]